MRGRKPQIQWAGFRVVVAGSGEYVKMERSELVAR